MLVDSKAYTLKILSVETLNIWYSHTDVYTRKAHV